MAVGLAVSACVGGASTSGPPNSDNPGSVATSPGGGSTSAETIPQPSLAALHTVTRGRLAPDGRRVDLTLPRFTDPTEVTNPLFPIAGLNAVILGEVEGDPLKIETTLLPQTETVTWRGRSIEALQSQFCAYLDGRITEVAVDLYAQADDGSVWYFGEDVVDYLNGAAATTEGTWRVGLDGPAAMIMPGHPKVGEVYRTENIPGVAFEQVTIKRVGVTVDGPSGPVPGAIVGQELHQDEKALEAKVFAPGYGEFFSGGGHDFEANALSVPADARPGPEPAELTTLTRGARALFDAARSSNWRAATGERGGMTAAWDAYRRGHVPERLAARMRLALDAVTKAVAARQGRAAAQAALRAADTGLDLELQYQRPATVNLDRFALWTRQLALDATARDTGAVHGDVTTLGWIRDRLVLDAAAGRGIDDQLRHLRAVAEAAEFHAAATQAARLRDSMRRASPVR